MNRTAILFVCAAFFSPAIAAQELALTADQIVTNIAKMNAQRAAHLLGYESKRYYELDYQGFPGKRHATMTVRVNFVSPKKQFAIIAQDGSKVLLDRVLHRLIETEKEADNDQDRAATALSSDNHDFTLLGTEAVGERRCYVLQVKPKRDHKLLYRGRIWVDIEDFAVARIAAEPARNPSLWISSTEIEHQYGKHGEFWLPATNRSVSKVRLGGRAVLTINYGEYENIRAE